ncbi:MAG: hypothetical protein M1817_001225 [Caeruleum heppii]|nr:MAG: hypothetical protein M1817_001225 [Caeruleum heppii]
MKLSRRGRSSTTETSDQHLTDGPLPTPPLPSGRTSTSTAGRNSLGGILNLSHRLRQNSEPPFPRRSLPGTPGECSSKPSSFSQSREPLVIPEREADETPAKYLARLEEAVSRGVVASILSRSNDSFSQAVLRSYMRSFAFFEDPMDMAIRKLLMEVELPKETQHIDRVLQGFADRYHECNPGIYASPDQAYFIAFSLLILHTDVFNKNNKHKMQRPEYLKNTRGEGVSDEILECLYDNISYTPFIHVEDDLDINGERIVAQKTRKTILPRAGADGVKKAPKGPVDPYSLILDRKLDVLRPTLKDVMNLDDPYGYLGTAGSLDLPNLQRSFFKSAILQIVSARSRPEAFMSPSTVANPEDAHPGLVDIKVTKVGVLWRKEVKRKKTRSAWQEWGAILTLSQLYFFRNAAWVKGLMHQYDTHHKAGQSTGPVLFKPPLENFKPDSIFSMDDAVALVDASYKKHKHAFLFVRHGGLEETYLADNERELNDWLAKLNYAAAFRTAGVRMRGLVGSNYDGQRSRGLRRMGSSDTGHSVQTPTGEVSIMSGKVDPLLAQQIRVARHQIMFQKITEAEAKLSVAQKQLDEQLRSARHLQILAPIQPKTREQLVLAAGRMAAQLKWIRMEIWRVKCHKDILNLDLEDEQKTSADVQLRNQKLGAAFVPSVPTRDSSKAALGRLESKSGMQSSPLRHAQPSIGTRAPNTSPSKVKEYGMDDIFQSPPEVTRQSSHKAQASWELPPLSFVASKSDLKGSSGTPHMLTPEHTPHASQSLANSTHSSPIPDSVLLARTPSADVRETEILKEAGLVTADGTSPRQAVDGTSDSGSLKDQSPNKPTTDGELHDRSKVRRSLHRTLREAHVPTHHRSKKGKDSSSSAGAVEDGPSLEQRSEGLARGTGSFTVHGKKASVITFGSEWQAMSPEERIQLRRQAHREGKKLLTPVMADDEATSMVSASLAEEEPVSPTSLIARRVEGDSVREEATGSEGRPSTRGTFDTESVASGKGSSEGERTPVMAVEYHGPKGVLSSGAGTSRTDDEPAAERPGTPIRDETDGNVDQDHSPRPKDTPTSPPRPRSQSATT